MSIVNKFFFKTLTINFPYLLTFFRHQHTAIFQNEKITELFSSIFNITFESINLFENLGSFFKNNKNNKIFYILQ